jgi:hypothetical protein
MSSSDDRIAKRRAEIAAQLAEFDRQEVEREAEVESPVDVVVQRRRGGAVRAAAFLICIIVLAGGLFGLAVTLSRLAGDDIGDARRLGTARVTRCVEAGPVSNKGFGYWDSCTATVTWDDGGADRLTIGVVFTSTDVDKDVRVGDLGNHRAKPKLARVDAESRPWLRWLGVAVGLVGLPPAIFAALIVQQLLRPRRR